MVSMHGRFTQNPIILLRKSREVNMPNVEDEEVKCRRLCVSDHRLVERHVATSSTKDNWQSITFTMGIKFFSRVGLFVCYLIG